MDTTVLEQRIKDIQQEITDDTKQIELRSQRIKDNKKVLKIYEDGLSKIKEKNVDQED